MVAFQKAGIRMDTPTDRRAAYVEKKRNKAEEGNQGKAAKAIELLEAVYVSSIRSLPNSS